MIGLWLRQAVGWFATDPVLAPVSYEAAWADVPPDWLAGRTEYDEDF